MYDGSEMDNFRKAFQDSLMEVLDSIIQVKDRVSSSIWKRICREVDAPIRCGGLGLGIADLDASRRDLVRSIFKNLVATLQAEILAIKQLWSSPKFVSKNRYSRQLGTLL